MWNDPAWVRWQIEHQKIGDPAAYNLWLMKKLNITIKVNIIPAMKAMNKAMISTAEATRRFKEVFESMPKLKDLNVSKAQ